MNVVAMSSRRANHTSPSDCPYSMNRARASARADALARFIDYGQSLGDVWFARRLDIATTFIEQQPSEQWL